MNQLEKELTEFVDTVAKPLADGESGWQRCNLFVRELTSLFAHFMDAVDEENRLKELQQLKVDSQSLVEDVLENLGRTPRFLKMFLPTLISGAIDYCVEGGEEVDEWIKQTAIPYLQDVRETSTYMILHLQRSDT